MTTETSFPVTSPATTLTSGRAALPFLCWSSIIGGTVAAIGIHILLTALGVGAGLAVFTPMTDSNPIANFSMGAAIIWTLSALVALWFGGFVAGRFSHSRHSGFVHGILVWSLTMIITLLLLSMGTGMVLGGALKILGEGLGIGGKVAAPVAGEMIKDAARRNGVQISSFIDEGVQSVPANGAPRVSIRAKREIGFAVTRLFAPGNDVSSVENRAAAVKALVVYANMSEADATKTVDEWTVSYNNLNAELDRVKAVADQRARETADKAASNLSSAAIWSFFALLIGLLVTSLGGSYGAKHALFSVNAQLDLGDAKRRSV